ncbi:MAG TPA: lysostaphin resistance A-like protein [Thermosynechococcaceae cyanobacterium]
MTIKRVILAVLTVLAIVLIGQDLIQSWSQPQFQGQLELYQTNLVLQSTEWQGQDENLATARKNLVGEKPIESAIEQYQTARKTAQKNLERTQSLLQSPTSDQRSLKLMDAKLAQSITELDLRLGLLQAKQNQISTAQATWNQVTQEATAPRLESLSKTAAVLGGLWSEPVRLLPNAESLIRKNLDGWFRYQALAQLYPLQERAAVLQTLQTEEQQSAEQALSTLTIVGGLPILACLVGSGILLFLVGQRLVQGKQAILSLDTIALSSVPWNWEIVWEVLILGFFFVGQILLPLAIGLLQSVLKFNPAELNERTQAFYILSNYLLLAAGGLSVLYFCLRPFLPLPEGWFRAQWWSKWLLWGAGGYFAALPLVILISLLNQAIWQGQGGSNPILPIALQGKDPVALLVFFSTAAIAAPIFEEILFRGFLLPSLTRYIPTWGAIGLSSLIFATAHLSLSEVLPLTVLGTVLGFVYVRSGNLLSSMLLHSLWNSGTLLSLFLLGRGSS